MRIGDGALYYEQRQSRAINRKTSWMPGKRINTVPYLPYRSFTAGVLKLMRPKSEAFFSVDQTQLIYPQLTTKQ